MREYKYDTLKGILIFFVVFAHFLITYDYLPKDSYNVIINSIFTFHMPLFFIISGYFSRKVKKNKIINYFAIFLFMQSSFFIYDYLRYGKTDFFFVNYSSWFVLLIAIYRLILCSKKISNLLFKKYSLLVIFILSILGGFIYINTIARLFTFFFFFVFGYRNKFNVQKKYCPGILVISISLLSMIVLSHVRLDLLKGLSYYLLNEVFVRMILFIADTLLFVGIVNLIKNKKIPVITSLGKNSLYIYVFHRIPVMLLCYLLYPYKYYFLISIVLSIVLCVLISYLSKYLKKLLDTKILLILSVIMFVVPYVLYNSNHELEIDKQYKLDNSISIGFVGDLILLEDQLKLSNNNFDYMFDNTKKLFDDTDYVFGVLEGPVDDNDEYSYGNFYDDKEIRLNYPSSFIKSIEKSGIDFVSIANNHMFDRGEDSFNATLDNLNNSKLDYAGNKNNYRIVDIEGLKVGVLAYTYGLNYLNNEDYSKYLNFLTVPYSKDFKLVKKNIHNDFMKLKESNVDLIIVMPHYGTQFSNQVDTYQEVWNRFFISEGADIILGDHSHAIQPIQYKKDSIIINSPGNYINSYIEYDGDLSMYVKVYVDKDNHKIIGSSVTPIIATKDEEGKYYPELLEDTSNFNQYRVKYLFGSVIFNDEITSVKNTYYYLPKDNYKYDNKYKMSLNDDDKESIVYQKIEEHNKICFIGDSITEGTVNGYNPWFIPLMSYFDKDVQNISKGSYTTYDILNDFSDDIKNSNCDLTIINIGTNDIRYNKEKVENYIDNIKKIIGLTKGEVIVLSPWQTTSRDYNIDKKDTEKRKLYEVCNEELKKLNNVYYINPNIYIKEVLEHNGEENYIIDGVHPNDNIGIELYSYAVMRSVIKD